MIDIQVLFRMAETELVRPLSLYCRPWSSLPCYFQGLRELVRPVGRADEHHWQEDSYTQA